MSRTPPAQSPSPGRAPDGADAAARAFRRARPDDAVAVALDTLMDERRVDMQTLAARLDVSPATLYRWFGSRPRLLELVCERLAEQFADEARAAACGEGDERVCDFARRIMVASAGSGAVRSFVAREPQVALRLLLRRDGAVHRLLADRMLEMLSEVRASDGAARLGESAHLIVQVATAMIWATFVVGEEPRPDSAVELIRMILASPPAA